MSATEQAVNEDANAAAEQAAAAAVFAQMRGGEAPQEAKAEPAAVEAAEVVAEDPAAAAERVKAEEDEWLKAAPASLRESLELVGRMRNFEGHIGGLTTVTKELNAKLAAVQTAVEKRGDAAPTQAQVAQAAGSLEKWDQMKEDFPEWHAALEERLAAQPGTASEKVDVDAIRKQIAFDLNAERVDEVHEGWGDTVKTPEFAAWFNAQPVEMQGLAKSPRARDAIKILDAYVEATKKEGAAEAPPRKDPRARLEAAVVPTLGKTVTRTETQSEAAAAAEAFKRIRGG